MFFLTLSTQDVDFCAQSWCTSLYKPWCVHPTAYLVLRWAVWTCKSLAADWGSGTFQTTTIISTTERRQICVWSGLQSPQMCTQVHLYISHKYWHSMHDCFSCDVCGSKRHTNELQYAGNHINFQAKKLEKRFHKSFSSFSLTHWAHNVIP